MLGLVPLLAAVALAVPTPAANTERVNVVRLEPFGILSSLGKGFGIAAAYERRLITRVAVYGRFAFLIPRRGLSHLVGLEQAFGVAAGAPHIGKGVVGTFAIGGTQHVFGPLPRHHAAALFVEAGLGGRWTFGNRFLLGASAGLRWTRAIRTSAVICTHRGACPAVEGVPAGQLRLEVGVMF